MHELVQCQLLPISTCHQVHRVFSKGAASREGTILRGDRIISINGTSLDGKTHAEVVSCLHQAKLSKQAIVVICRCVVSEKNTTEKLDSASQQQMSLSGTKMSLETSTGTTLIHTNWNNNETTSSKNV